MRLTVLLPLLVLIAFPAGAAASGQDEASPRLGVEALDAEGPYFDITLEPGDSAGLAVRFINHGEEAAQASVYPADVYTIPGGGMGIERIDSATGGATEWLSFEPRELELDAGEAVDQPFTVTVPEDTPPGEYITSIVIQNRDPIDIGADENQFNQTVRQGVAVNIDIPGQRDPALEIDGDAETNAGDTSMVIFELENTGNAHLRPEGEVVLENESGEVVAEIPVMLDTVYAGTETVLEVRLAERLEPGRYEAAVRLADPDLDQEWTRDEITLETGAPSDEPVQQESDAEPDGAGGLVVDPDESGPGAGAWAMAVVLVLAIASFLFATLVYIRRRTSRRFEPVLPAQRVRRQPDSDGEKADRPRPQARPVRQLQPRKRSG